MTLRHCFTEMPTSPLTPPTRLKGGYYSYAQNHVFKSICHLIRKMCTMEKTPGDEVLLWAQMTSFEIA